MSILREYEEENNPSGTEDLSIPMMPQPQRAAQSLPQEDAASSVPIEEVMPPQIESPVNNLGVDVGEGGGFLTQQDDGQQLPMLQPDLDRSPRIPFQAIDFEVDVPRWQPVDIPEPTLPTDQNAVERFLNESLSIQRSQMLNPVNAPRVPYTGNPILEALSNLFGKRDLYEKYYKNGYGQLGAAGGFLYGLTLPFNIVSGVASDLGRIGAAAASGADRMRQEVSDMMFRGDKPYSISDLGKRMIDAYGRGYNELLGLTATSPYTATQEALFGRQFSFADERVNERGDFNPFGLLPEYGTYKRAPQLRDTPFSDAVRKGPLADFANAATSIIGMPLEAALKGVSGNSGIKIPKISDWLADRVKQAELDPSTYWRSVAGFGLDAIVDGYITDFPGYISKAANSAVKNAPIPDVKSSALARPIDYGFSWNPGTVNPRTYRRQPRLPGARVYEGEPVLPRPAPPELQIPPVSSSKVDAIDAEFRDVPLLEPSIDIKMPVERGSIVTPPRIEALPSLDAPARSRRLPPGPTVIVPPRTYIETPPPPDFNVPLVPTLSVNNIDLSTNRLMDLLSNPQIDLRPYTNPVPFRSSFDAARQLIRDNQPTTRPGRNSFNSIVESVKGSTYRSLGDYSNPRLDRLRQLANNADSLDDQLLDMNKVVADFIDDNNELLSIEEKFSILRNPESVSDVINKYTGAERNQLVSSLVNNANSNKFFNLPETAQLLYELKTPNVMLDMAAYNEIYRSLPKDLRPAPGNPIGAVRMQEFLNANTQLETALRDLNELQDTYNQLKAEITEATGKSASRQVLDETVTEASLSKGTRADEPSIQVGDRLTNEDEVAQAQARNVTQLTEQEASSPKVLRTLGQDLRVLDAATSRQVKLALQDMEMMLPPDEFELQKSAMFEDLALEGYDVTSDGVVINPNKFSIVSAEEIEDVTSGLDLRAAGFIDDPSELSALNLQAQMLDEISERLEEGYKELDRSITRAEDAEDLLRASAETYADNYNELTKQSPQSYEKDFTDLLVNEDERLFKHYDVIPPSPTYYSIWNDYLDEIFQAIRYDDPDSILDTAISWRNSHREMWEEAAQVYESAVEVYRDLKELHGEWVPDDFFPTLDEVC